MAGRERELKVVVTGEDRGATKALGKVEDAAKKIGPSTQIATNGIESVSAALTSRLGPAAKPAEDALNKLGTAALASGGALKAGLVGGVVVGTAALGAFAVAGIDAARDQSEALSKSNEVFGQSAAAIEKWASGAARDFGQSKKGALEAAGTFGNMFTQLGIGEDVAAGMSRAMTELASDFVAFHGGNVTDAIAAQTAAFRGEYDAVQRFVPTINAAAVEQQALAMGLANSTKELDAQDKALATYQLLLDGAGKAAGNFDQTSGDLAQQQRTLTAQVEDLSAAFGESLIPVLTDVAGVAVPVLDAFKALADRLGGLDNVIRKVAEGAAPTWVRELAPLLKVLQQRYGDASDEAEAMGRIQVITGKQAVQTAADFAKADVALDAHAKVLRSVTAAETKLAQAERALAEAPAKAARERERAAEAVEDAHRSLADAQEAAAESVVSANRRIEDSHRSLDDAHRREIDAHQSLAEAREGAAEDLENLRLAQERNALAEERAALGVDKARQDIGKSKTLTEEKEARLGLKEAELSLSEAQERRREDAEALNAAEAAGVEGSRRVMDAKRGVEEAIRAVGDAERAVTEATAGASKAQEEGARAVEAAQRSLKEAIVAVSDVAQASADAQVSALQAVRDAELAVVEAQKKGEESAAKVLQLTRERQAVLDDIARLEQQVEASGPGGGRRAALDALRPARPPGRAAGGPVAAGTLYEVNEEGTGDNVEYFRPNLTGNVIPLRAGGADQPATAAAATPVTITFAPVFHVIGELNAFDRWELNKWWDAALERNLEKISRAIGSS